MPPLVSSSPPRFDHYDVIIIGSGAGGGTLAWSLADTSARILIVERGGVVPSEPQNWDPAAVYAPPLFITDEP